MDSVRFGRALGTGARAAARALAQAADAAAAPAPAGRSSSVPAREPHQVRETQITGRPQPASSADPRTTSKTLSGTPRGVRQGGRRFGQAVWGPFARLSGVLLLEVTGVLFGLFAAVAGLEAWRGRNALYAGTVHPERTHELLALAMLALFGYFTASSFLRAKRRGRA